ncbi:M48 family metalloprotease [Haloarcula salina]|uniref:M48 family metalloprotease n=1 Tax=Haloarcula salina TaxID=1429914 RepID=A0AA41G6G0_9EURY|nr:M48 family metalloprotease [Haloarcula salina]MBV0900967.1 M48 family metalloprotease [Haloarcula salina]
MRTLTRRILRTLVLLLAVDLAVVATAAFLLTPWLVPVRDAVAAQLPFGDASTRIAWWLAVLLPALVAFVWAQLRYTRAQTMAEVDAREVGPEAYPDLHERVRRLAQLADVEPPRLAVADSAVPNSFALGTLGGATVVVSEGLLSALDGDELDAVLAHELAHVANRDATVMTLASFLPSLTDGGYDPLADHLPGGGRYAVGAVALVAAYAGSARLLDAPLGSLSFTLGFLFLFACTALVGGVALGALTAPVVVLGRSLSRAREFAADRSAARLTGDPAALVRALEALDGSGDDRPTADKRRAYASVQGLCFLPHGFGAASDGTSSVVTETRSHPPTDERIERLRAVAREIEARSV